MYQSQSDFLKKYAPGRPLDSVLIVSGDGFFDKASLAKLGFVRACFIADHWHLRESGLEDIFWKRVYPILSTQLLGMMKAKSFTRFEECYAGAKDILQSESQLDGVALAALDKFAADRGHYAYYCLEMIPGNRGRKGSVAVEINHSSVLCSLNGDHVKTNTYCEDPIVLCRDLMKRQDVHVRFKNLQLHEDNVKMTIELEKLGSEPVTEENVSLRKAAKVLALPYYL